MRGDVRASDTDRQAVVDHLSTATGEGLLTLDEFSDAAGRAYASRTRADLERLLVDLQLPEEAPLPVVAEPGSPAPAQPDPRSGRRRWVVAMLSGKRRKGRWRVPGRLGAVALMGRVKLDLRDAVLTSGGVDVEACAVMGGVEVVVPEGIPVETGGFMLMGRRCKRVRDVPAVPGAPVVRVRGYGLWGAVDVRSKPPREEHRGGDADRRRTRSGPDLRIEVVAATVPAPPVPPRPGLPPVDTSATPAPDPPNGAHRRGLVTIVATDLVGSTRMSDQLGDQRWWAVLRSHNDLVREALGRRGGTEVKTSGDGFLCTFDSARRAVAFAAEVHDALERWSSSNPDTPLTARIGVHAGEVERDGADIVGRNVSLTCRLCDVAAAGEVLVSEVVAVLADSASDLVFGESRTVALAGIDRPVTVRPLRRT